MSNSVTNRLFKMVISYWPLLIVSTISAFIYVAFNGLSVWLTASLFNNILTDFEDLIINHDNLRNTKVTINDQLKYWTNELILRDTALESLKVLCYTIIGSFLFKNIFLYLKNIALTYIQFNLITKLRVRLYAHLQKMSLSYFDRSQSGALSSIVLNDVSNMRVAFGASFHKLFVEPINIILFVALLLIINLKLALISIIIVPLSGAIVILIGRSIRRKSKRTAEKIARIMSIMAENLNSIRVVKSFSMESFETDRFTGEQERYYQLIFRRAKLRLISSPIIEMIGAFIGVCLLWIGGHDVLVAQSMNSEDFIRFILILFSVLGPIRNLSNVSVELQKGFASADRVFEVLDTTVSIKSKPNATTISELNDQISFDNVSFNYDGNDRVLKDVSFNMKKGTVTALVGSSGAGKSTIADLIPRFYDVVDGSVTMDGVDIRDIEINSLRRLMGIVSQETILFNDTIKSNIKYGLQSVSDQRLEEAAKNANALDFIKEQPEGFETMIGEKGVRLSGGQRQRIAIARGILKNPPLLILDEATSSLDTESEYLVQTAIDNLMADRTVLVIAHRLTTVENADSILVMDSGQIVGSGTHQELLSQEGLYTRLYNKQFKK
ncbi:MAG: ABC transporter ATP-binding protein/permease [Candidatus Marinimicrobia bacterium]|nr:ABC transporter ATP-binding protein/permease [Candidatus Neomarinimicrobiota bacterium]